MSKVIRLDNLTLELIQDIRKIYKERNIEVIGLIKDQEIIHAALYKYKWLLEEQL